MAKNTKIEWATATWNPWFGCSKVSPACDNCYAERWANRTGKDFSKITRSRTTFNDPLKWKEPQRIFVCSLSDFFHLDVPRSLREEAIAVMQAAPQHTYMLLTKRPDNILPALDGTAFAKLPDNVWLGVTAENQEQANKRIPLLLQVPARVCFVSCESLLGPIRLKQQNPDGFWPPKAKQPDEAWLRHKDWPDDFEYWSTGLSWVICGGESGSKARPMHPTWARSLRDQCQAAGVPFFFKQWGEWFPESQWEDNPDLLLPEDYYIGPDVQEFEHDRFHKVGVKKSGFLLDGQEWKELPRDKGVKLLLKE